jgi:hypothetical protein
MSATDLRRWVEKVDIRVLYSRVVDETARKNIEEILIERLHLRRSQGDTISSRDSGININKPLNEVEREMQSTLAKLRVAELAAAEEKAKADALTAEIKPWRDGRPFLERHATTIAVLIGLALVIGFFMMVWMSSGAIRGVGAQFFRGAAALAQAMESSLQSREGGQVASLKTASGADENASMRSSVAAGESPAVTEARVEKLRGELLTILTSGNEHIALSYLHEMLGDESTIARAVAVIELLGRERALAFAQKLSRGAQSAIARFLRESRYDRPKGEVMVEAGEMLKTRLLAADFGKLPGADAAAVESRLLKLGVDDLVSLVVGMEQELIPRLFLFLKADVSINVLNRLAYDDPSRVEGLSRLLSRMPEARAAQHLDVKLIKILDGAVQRSDEDIYKPYLHVFKEWVEVSEGDMAERLMSGLCSEPRLGSYLERHVLTFASFHTQPADTQDLILEGLPLKDYAVLLWQLTEAQRQGLLARQPERRREAILDELETLNGRSRKRVESMARQVRASVVTRMKALREAGELEMVAASKVAVGDQDEADVGGRKRAPGAKSAA